MAAIAECLLCGESSSTLREAQVLLSEKHVQEIQQRYQNTWFRNLALQIEPDVEEYITICTGCSTSEGVQVLNW